MASSSVVGTTSNLLAQQKGQSWLLPVLGSLMTECAGTILIPERHRHNRQGK